MFSTPLIVFKKSMTISMFLLELYPPFLDRQQFLNMSFGKSFTMIMLENTDIPFSDFLTLYRFCLTVSPSLYLSYNEKVKTYFFFILRLNKNYFLQTVTKHMGSILITFSFRKSCLPIAVLHVLLQFEASPRLDITL